MAKKKSDGNGFVVFLCFGALLILVTQFQQGLRQGLLSLVVVALVVAFLAKMGTGD